MDNCTRHEAAEIMFYNGGYNAAVNYLQSRVRCRQTAESIAADIHHRGE